MKLEGFSFWKETLGGAQHVVAPMVDASELAWRLLCRRHGAQLCYTPMLHSNVFCRDIKYRKEALTTCPEDRPLIVQFCGNDPKTMLEAALLAEEYCDAIDINLGCPQAIAKRGHYGSFLQDEWALLTEIVSTLHHNLHVPVTCKVRIFEDVQKSVEYARMLEAAGCQLLTVHGRTREQKGPLTGLADWNHINTVRKAINIPIFANGNIQCLADINICLRETGAAGIMTAEGNLYNPFIFEGVNPPVWKPALEYLALAELHPPPNSYIRGHLFKLFHALLVLPENFKLRTKLGAATTHEDFTTVCYQLRDRYLPYHEGKSIWIENDEESKTYNLSLPPWLCQSYVRMPPHEHIKKMEEKNLHNNNTTNGEIQLKRTHYEDAEGNEISRKRMKKLRRVMRRPEKPPEVINQPKRGNLLCQTCPNPLGTKCIYKLCKQCCRNKCYTENLDCPGHRIQVKTRRQVAKDFARLREENNPNENLATDIKCTEVVA